jgi:hypothetical protein
VVGDNAWFPQLIRSHRYIPALSSAWLDDVPENWSDLFLVSLPGSPIGAITKHVLEAAVPVDIPEFYPLATAAMTRIAHAGSDKPFDAAWLCGPTPSIDGLTARGSAASCRAQTVKTKSIRRRHEVRCNRRVSQPFSTSHLYSCTQDGSKAGWNSQRSFHSCRQ